MTGYLQATTDNSKKYLSMIEIIY